MEIKKAHWSTDGDNYRMDMAVTKVDKENRLVTGWASLDNPDLQGDIVLAEASEKAFANFRGNIREMHQPIAVGRMVSYRPDSYYDTTTQKFYNGIVVTAYVSKGAQDTWEKVLDGTLQAFSIKGPIKDSVMEFSKDAGRPLRIVKDYELEELSLVDSGGNQFANIMSITKSVDGEVTVTGMVADSKSENVFWCKSDTVYKTSTDDSAECPNGHTMDNVGWFEYMDDDKVEKLNEFIANHNSSTVAKQESPANNEGGVNVAEETNEPSTTEVEPGQPVAVENEVAEEGKAVQEVEHSNEALADNEEVAPVEEEADVEKAADVSEVEADEPDFAKMFGDLQTAISGVEKNSKDAQEAVEKATATFEAKIEELAKSHGELTEKFESLQTEVANVEKALRTVEDGTAVKKSGDLGGSTEDKLEKSNKSRWGGRFLSTTDL